MATAQIVSGATRSMFCACPDFTRVLFLTIVVQNVVQVAWLPNVTSPRRGFLWKGACMRNRKLRNIYPSRAFSPVGHQSHDPKGGSLGRAHPQPEVGISRPFFGCFRICCVVLHIRDVFFCVFLEMIWKIQKKK